MKWISEHQTLLFSATMPDSIKKLAKKYLNEPITIELNIDQIAPQSLQHVFEKAYGHRKIENLFKYLDSEKPEQAIVFCKSRNNCERTYDQMKDKYPSCEMIHGGIEQGKRSSIFNRFKKKKIQYIVATDIASRGLDFSEVTHVINFDFPDNPEIYTHRTGRTARMGRKGTAVTFYGNNDLSVLKSIIKNINIAPEWIGEKPDLENVRTGKKSSKRIFKGKRKSGPFKRKNKSTQKKRIPL